MFFTLFSSEFIIYQYIQQHSDTYVISKVNLSLKQMNQRGCVHANIVYKVKYLHRYPLNGNWVIFIYKSCMLLEDKNSLNRKTFIVCFLYLLLCSLCNNKTSSTSFTWRLLKQRGKVLMVIVSVLYGGDVFTHSY